MREITLDTETTGLKVKEGHCIIEIGCVEMINRIVTGNNFHVYINPQRQIDHGAFKVHGISSEFLQDKPLFKDIAKDFIDFIGDATLVIHNAPFDLGFLNAELAKYQFANITNKVIDTLLVAREKFPGSPANLDALCKRFAVDLSKRQKHAELLADVYIELSGGKQTGFNLDKEEKGSNIDDKIDLYNASRKFIAARDFKPSESELSEHNQMLDKLQNPIWKKIS